MTDVLIPKGFYPIAESEFRSGTGIVYFNKDRRELLIFLDGKPFGKPFEPVKLECLMHVMNDVKEMKGKYGPLSNSS